MPDSKPVSDLTFPNVERLRQRCLERFYEAPFEQWTAEEYAGIRAVAASYAYRTAAEISRRYALHTKEQRRRHWEEHPLCRALERDIAAFEPPIPKWVCLAAWLAPEGLCTLVPEIIVEIARLAIEDRLIEPGLTR